MSPCVSKSTFHSIASLGLHFFISTTETSGAPLGAMRPHSTTPPGRALPEAGTKGGRTTQTCQALGGQQQSSRTGGRTPQVQPALAKAGPRSAEEAEGSAQEGGRAWRRQLL